MNTQPPHASRHLVWHPHSSPVSRIDAPCLLFGSMGVAIAVVMDVFGLFELANDRLLSFMIPAVFSDQTPQSLPWFLPYFVAIVCSFGIAFIVLDTLGWWRRFIVGVTGLILLVALLPTFAVWKIYFSPFIPLVAVFWTWFFTMIYANHHLMPCELAYHSFYYGSYSENLESGGGQEFIESLKSPINQSAVETSNLINPEEKYRPPVDVELPSNKDAQLSEKQSLTREKYHREEGDTDGSN